MNRHKMNPTKYIFSTSHGARYRFPTHINDLIMDRVKAERCETFMVILRAGQAPPLHTHPDVEQVFYVIEGKGMLCIGPSGRSRTRVSRGDSVYVPKGLPHSIYNDGKKRLRYFAVDVFCKRQAAEPTWESHVRNVCRAQGWNFRDVVKSCANRRH